MHLAALNMQVEQVQVLLAAKADMELEDQATHPDNRNEPQCEH